MNIKRVKRNVVLGILFFLPVTFLLFLYPSTHNYNTLEIVKENVQDLEHFTSISNDTITLKGHLTVLAFLGTNPMQNLTEASNLKELVYDKFKGFKGFQIVVVLPNGSQEEATQLRQEISTYEDIRFWHFVFGQPQHLTSIFSNLNSDYKLDENLSTSQVFIIDKDSSQRGRLDDRTDNELEKNSEAYGLFSYNCIEVAEIKHKMSEDLRILFTEYRQKRKGDFDSSSRRENDLTN